MVTLKDRIELILAALALLGIFVGWLRYVRPRLRKGAERAGAALDTIAGRPAVIDSITGKELAPELPSIGKRMDAMEVSVARLVEVIESQHKQDERLDDHEQRLDHQGEQIKQLQDAVIERVASKAESAAAWRAVEAVARQVDPTSPEIEK